jgi:hypothetical protein
MENAARTGLSARRGARLERAVQTYVRGLNPAGVARQFAAILASGSVRAVNSWPIG